MQDRESIEEERDFCLRSLKDLDAELAAGDIDEDDYRTLRDSYTVRAANALKALAPAPINGNGTTGTGAAANGSRAPDAVFVNGSGHHNGSVDASARTGVVGRDWRRRAGVAIGVVVIAAGACWMVVESSATRLPGEEITGKTLGSEQVASQLLAAQNAITKGDDVSALKDYQEILSAQPEQPEALTGEGWLLAQTGQPSLLKQGLDMLAKAETAAPDYAPAHLYRGIALLSEDDYSGAVPELQWYLGHSPDPQLAPKVRDALQQAEAKAKAQG